MPAGYHLKWRRLIVPPGETRRYWAVFAGYHYLGSDVPRRITLSLPAPTAPTTPIAPIAPIAPTTPTAPTASTAPTTPAPPTETPPATSPGERASGPAPVVVGAPGGADKLELVLADPARAGLRWQVEPVASTWMLGVQNHTMFGDHLRALAVATQITRTARAGRFLWDVGFASRLLVQTRGVLRSATSAFTGLGVGAHLTVPVATWGRADNPRAVGFFVGGEAQVLVAVEPDRPAGDSRPPPSYGVLAAEGGLELDLGAIRRAPTPFPLAQAPGRAPLPRLVTRLGYTHWWVDGGGSDGYTAGFRLVW